jgi:hypothetical protein
MAASEYSDQEVKVWVGGTVGATSMPLLLEQLTIGGKKGMGN